MTPAALLRQTWDNREATDTNRVHAFVKQIRARLGNAAASPRWIFNQPGVGYRMPGPGEE